MLGLWADFFAHGLIFTGSREEQYAHWQKLVILCLVGSRTSSARGQIMICPLTDFGLSAWHHLIGQTMPWAWWDIDQSIGEGLDVKILHSMSA